MYEEIKAYIDSCHTCQVQAKRGKNNELNPITPTALWEQVKIDFIRPFNIIDQGNQYIITAIDYFTQWPEAKVVPNVTAEITAKFIYMSTWYC